MKPCEEHEADLVVDGNYYRFREGFSGLAEFEYYQHRIKIGSYPVQEKCLAGIAYLDPEKTLRRIVPQIADEGGKVPTKYKKYLPVNLKRGAD